MQKGSSAFRLEIPLYVLALDVQWLEGASSSEVLSLQPVEPHPWTPTHDISVRTRSLVFLTRSWVSLLASLGWGTWLAGFPEMRDCTSPLAAR